MAKLVELLEKIIGGGTPSKNENKYWNGNIPWASVKDIGENQVYLSYTQDSITKEGLAKSSSNLIPKGNVIIPTRMGLGRCVINKIDTAINQDLKALIPKKDKLNNKYLLYWLKFNAALIESMGSGTTVKGIRLEQLTELELNDIDIKIQQKIARILSNYDDLIENNNRRIKILEEMAQKIYKEWFVDFKFPGHETTTFKDSPLGKIPNDWEVKLFSDYFDIQNGFAFKSKDYSNNGVKIIRTKDFASTKYINITDPIFLPNQLKSKYETYMLQEYDFLLIMVGASIGKYGIVLKKDMPSLQNQNMWALRPKNNYIYLKNYSIFMFENLIKKVLSFATGAAREFFRKEHFNNQRIIVPNSCVLNLFNQITNDILNEISNLYTKNENLKQTRDILLPRLISGEINVENMEIK